MSYPIQVIGDLAERAEKVHAVACSCKQAADAALPALQAASTIGDLIVWPSDVDAAIDALDARYESQNADIATCVQAGKLPASAGSTWVQQYQAWKTWAGPHKSKPYTTLLLSNPAFSWAVVAQAQDDMSHVQAFQAQLADWNAKTKASGCTLSSPEQEKPSNPAQPLDINSLVKWSVVGVVAIALALIVRKVA